jgi:hypothetical protein
MSRLLRALVTGASTLLLLTAGLGSPAVAGLAPGDSVEGDPSADWGWERAFVDTFDGPAGTLPAQWHVMTGWNPAVLDGQGRLDVGHLAQLRSTSGWTLPVGTQVRVTASLVMPDTGSNYAALWVQHPDPADPREVDVIESYGPLKTAGAQLASHLCYDETDGVVGDSSSQCESAGLGAELWPVGDLFPDGVKPWQASWEYATEFTIGGDSLRFTAADGSGSLAYDVTTGPDPRRVPGNARPFHLRLSNKDVDPEHVVPGGTQHSMYVDWVTVDVKYP